MRFTIDEINDVLMFGYKVPTGLLRSLDGTNTESQKEIVQKIVNEVTGKEVCIKDCFSKWKRWCYLCKIIRQIR